MQALNIAGKKMKIIYYRTLLKRAKNLTPNERILYSFLVAKSISSIEQIWDVNGDELNQDVLDEYFSEFGNWFKMCTLNHTKMAKELHLTRKTIINGLAKLEKLGYIRYNQYCELEIFINKELLKSGYFELYNINQLSGELVVFYSYLVNKGQQYDYCIDTFKYRLAEDLGKTTTAITKLLNRLYRLGFAERLDNGKLLINKFGKLK